MWRNEREEKKQSPIVERSCCYLVVLWFINSFLSLKTSNMLIWKIKEQTSWKGRRWWEGKPDHKTWNLQEAWSL